MTLFEAIRKAAVTERPIELSPKDAERVLAALDWGQETLEDLNCTGDETFGGNSKTSGLEETFEGTLP